MQSVVRVTPASAGPDDHQYLTIEPLLSADECREWIDFAEQLGFYDAPINLGGGVEMRRPVGESDRLDAAQSADPARSDKSGAAR